MGLSAWKGWWSAENLHRIAVTEHMIVFHLRFSIPFVACFVFLTPYWRSTGADNGRYVPCGSEHDMDCKGVAEAGLGDDGGGGDDVRRGMGEESEMAMRARGNT